MDNFIGQLADIVEEDSVLPFLQHFTTFALRHQALLCRHDRLRPAAMSTCFSAGTSDIGKAMAVRKSTVFSAAFDYAILPKPPAGSAKWSELIKPSTKIRVHHLFKLAACNNIDDLRADLDSGTTLLHFCGHGICTPSRPLACVNPQHTGWGTQDINVRHTYAHEVLELVQSPAEYAILCTILQRNPAYDGVF